MATRVTNGNGYPYFGQGVSGEVVFYKQVLRERVDILDWVLYCPNKSPQKIENYLEYLRTVQNQLLPAPNERSLAEISESDSPSAELLCKAKILQSYLIERTAHFSSPPPRLDPLIEAFLSLQNTPLHKPTPAPPTVPRPENLPSVRKEVTELNSRFSVCNSWTVSQQQENCNRELQEARTELARVEQSIREICWGNVLGLYLQQQIERCRQEIQKLQESEPFGCMRQMSCPMTEQALLKETGAIPTRQKQYRQFFSISSDLKGLQQKEDGIQQLRTLMQEKQLELKRHWEDCKRMQCKLDSMEILEHRRLTCCRRITDLKSRSLDCEYNRLQNLQENHRQDRVRQVKEWVLSEQVTTAIKTGFQDMTGQKGGPPIILTAQQTEIVSKKGNKDNLFVKICVVWKDPCSQKEQNGICTFTVQPFELKPVPIDITWNIK